MTIILRIISVLVSLFFVALLTFTGCMTFRTSDQKVLKTFEKEDVAVQIKRIPFEDREIRYVESGMRVWDTISPPMIVFVHGAPGSEDNFHKYLKDSTLLNNFQMASLDRPGYGYSGYGKSVPSIEAQAQAVKAVIDQFPNSKPILVGHSYGGPIIAKCAMDFPERLAAIVMLAPVNDPETEKIFWYAYFAKWGITRWMLSKALRVSGDEKFAHPDELRKIQDEWSKINIPIIHIHGMKDKQLAPSKGNIAFSKTHINPDILNMIVIDKTGHMIPWSDYDIVKQELLKLLMK
ncbi:MAG: alpha/beta hydrolase [Saprospiraceae bacterium]|nr:alpha/beta hydrolase [Saprospiraceae bacterium]